MHGYTEFEDLNASHINRTTHLPLETTNSVLNPLIKFLEMKMNRNVAFERLYNVADLEGDVMLIFREIDKTSQKVIHEHNLIAHSLVLNSQSHLLKKMKQVKSERVKARPNVIYFFEADIPKEHYNIFKLMVKFMSTGVLALSEMRIQESLLFVQAA